MKTVQPSKPMLDFIYAMSKGEVSMEELLVLYWNIKDLLEEEGLLPV